MSTFDFPLTQASKYDQIMFIISDYAESNPSVINKILNTDILDKHDTF